MQCPGNRSEPYKTIMSGVVRENVRENHQETTRGVAQAVMLPVVRGNVRENSINPVNPVQCPGNPVQCPGNRSEPYKTIMSGVVRENVRENHQETTRGVAQAVILPIVRGNVRENSINPVDPVQCPGNSM